MKSPAATPRVTRRLFQIRLPAAEYRMNWPKGIFTTPAGTEMKLRTIGTMRPKNTADRPCRSNHAKVRSTSAGPTSGRRAREGGGGGGARGGGGEGEEGEAR